MIAVDSRTGLPDGWTVHLKPTLNLTTITIVDQLGRQRICGFIGKQIGERTVRAIRYIPDRAIRERARHLLRRHLDEQAAILANLRAISAELPDYQQLVDRLTANAPGTEVTFGANDSTELTLTLTAPDLIASGTVLALLADWLRAQGHTSPQAAEGIAVDLYKQTLTIALAQHHAIDFLTWFRDHGAGGCAHCVADGVERAFR
ncbi:hypothetical protein IU436_29815 [Nocardia farcinica]|uniref:hypothetical protein n=1 Tax=Nocardia TaxID=1817 RepID=UPI001894F2D8|nr:MULTISPECIES: hypothetical protein [Nocardia]MBF6216400.1 hypothetical protein [Nocardia puris]MBF6422909.1 hypothetical protein [Nocardia farcinica]MBF6434518.1 hypothetical protein [Nocardia farcinica]MBF6505603.1 hypothetical protein [Nocardia farcinica]